MIKLALTSDTHYGHSNNTHRIHEKWLTLLAAEIKANDIKALLHAGDWISYKQDQLPRTLKLFRKYIDIPILGVRGNHCIWQGGDRRKYGFEPHYKVMLQKHEQWFMDNNVHLMDFGPTMIEDVLICGFDGWYNCSNPSTNDELYMGFDNVEGCPIMPYLSNRAYTQLDTLLQTDTSTCRASVIVTHHPPYCNEAGYEDLCANPKFLDPIADKFDVLCTGHSHREEFRKHGELLIVNAGGDYNKPRHKVFEV